MDPSSSGNYDVCVVGGAGHVGAPLAIVLAQKGFRTLIYDLNPQAMERLQNGELPFLEEGGGPLLREVLAAKRLGFATTPEGIASCSYIIITIGTPIDEFQNPMLGLIQKCIDSLSAHLSDGQTIILRSTIFPGVTDWVHQYLRGQDKRVHVAFCPERVVQGYSIRELQTLPQIISGATPEAEESAARLFSALAPKLVRMAPKEAEFAKLFSNAYRYIQFAATNQFYMMVETAGLDYHRVLAGMKADYPRLRDLPGPGFAAGPCLHKDTLQLAAFANHQFAIGYSAIQVNEGLPAFLVARLAARYRLSEMTVGILGMAFKADSDDIRSSLSYKLKKILRNQAKAVLTTDPLVDNDRDLLPLEEVIGRSDLLILAVPHSAYQDLNTQGKPLFNIWNG